MAWLKPRKNNNAAPTLQDPEGQLHTCTHFMHAHTYVYIYIYTYTQKCVCIYIYICVCVHVCMYVCMYACMHVCMYACMHVCMYACIHVCMYACVRVRVHVTAGATTHHIMFDFVLAFFLCFFIVSLKPVQEMRASLVTPDMVSSGPKACFRCATCHPAHSGLACSVTCSGYNTVLDAFAKEADAAGAQKARTPVLLNAINGSFCKSEAVLGIPGNLVSIANVFWTVSPSVSSPTLNFQILMQAQLSIV